MSSQPGTNGLFPNGCYTKIGPDGELIYAAGSYKGYSQAASKEARKYVNNTSSNTSISESQRKQIDDNLKLFSLIINHSCWDREQGNIQAIKAMQEYLKEPKCSSAAKRVWKDPSLTNITSILLRMRVFIRQHSKEKVKVFGLFPIERDTVYSTRIQAFYDAIGQGRDFEEVIDEILGSSHTHSVLKKAMIKEIADSGNKLEEYQFEREEESSAFIL